MSGFIKILLSLSFSGTFLIIILLLLKPLYKNKLSQKWQYYIWLVVIARLLLPFTIKYNILEKIPGQVYYMFIQTNKEENLIQPGLQSPDTATSKNIATSIPVANQKENNIQKQNSTTNNSTNTNQAVKTLLKNILLFLKKNIFYIWIVTAVSLFIHKITIYQCFTRYLKDSQTEISSLNIWEQLGKMLEKLHIKTTVGIYTNNMVSSPILIGFFHPYIILPSEEIQNIDLQNTIHHELIHFKRKDMFYKWLVQFTLCIHWFNPFVYLISYETSRLCELSCDEAVIKKLNEKGKKEYGNTLLNMANTEKNLKSSIVSVTLNEGKKLLKERLDKIMVFKKKTITCTCLSIALTLILCTTAAITGNANIIKPGTSQANKKNIYTKTQNSNNTTNPDKDTIDKLISEGRVILDNGIYHILCDDVDIKDISSGVVTNGCIGITLEKADGYYLSIGPIDIKRELDGLTEYVEKVCNNEIKKKNITKEEAGLMTSLAKKLKKENGKIDMIKDISIARQYKKYGIVEKNNTFYYKNKRIRIFVDIRADQSFVIFNYDKKGTVNIEITRNKKGKISNVKSLSKKDADKYLMDIDLKGTVDVRLTSGKRGAIKTLAKTKKNGEYTNIKRCGLDDVPDDVQTIIKKQCTGNNWYVIKTNNKKYVYYNNLPRDYAFNISGKNLNVRDIGRHTGIYVLLSLGNGFNFTLSYNAKPVTFTVINAN